MLKSMVFSVMGFRLKLLIRQKLGWMSLLLGCALIFLSVGVAQVSFINSLKIFWDFALAASFIIQIVLAIYLSSQLYFEESSKRTLHLLLSSGLSRLSWFLGNCLGIFLGLTLSNFLWLGFSFICSRVFFSDWGMPIIQIQSQCLLAVEILIVVFLTFFISLFVRPLIALVASFSSVALLHSVDSLQRIFTDPESGRFVNVQGVRFVLWASRLLPPLEWLDLKSFVGYRPQMEWLFVGQMTLLGLMWVVVIGVAAAYRFDRMDL